MAHTVFILGAGASKEAGVPLMSEFLDVAYRLWKTDQVKDQDEHFRRVFSGISALQRVHSKSQLDIDNIESVFATFEMAKTLGTFPSHAPDEIPKLTESLRVAIATTIESTLLFHTSAQRVVPPHPYEPFVNLIRGLRDRASPRQSVAVLTFNYDLALDFALFRSGIPIDYALDDQQNNLPLPFLKLHGSLNWGHSTTDGKVLPWRLDDFVKKHPESTWPAIRNSQRLRMVQFLGEPRFDGAPEIASTPVIVPPTWDKSEHHRSLSSVWRRAAKELGEAENIFVIGYSLPETDAFFRYLYALGTVGDVLLRRFWVFNPDASLKDRYLKMLGHAPSAPRRFQFFSEMRTAPARTEPMKFVDAVSRLRQEFPFND